MRSPRRLSSLTFFSLLIALAIFLRPANGIGMASAVAATSTGPFAYIANSNNNTVIVIDTSTNMPVGSPIPVGADPSTVTADPTGARVYVGNLDDGTVSAIDTVTKSVAWTVPAAKTPVYTLLNESNTKLYVADGNWNGNNAYVWVISTANGALLTKISLTPPTGCYCGVGSIAMNQAGTRLYVGVSSGRSGQASLVATVDTSTDQILSTFTVQHDLKGGFITDVSGSRLYTVNNSESSVTIIDLTTDTALAPSIPVGLWPDGIALSASGSRLYVENQGSSSISVIDTSINSPIGSPITVGSAPEGLALTPDGTRIYVPSDGSGNIFVIDTNTNSVDATIAVGGGLRAFGQFIASGTPVSSPPVASKLAFTQQPSSVAVNQQFPATVVLEDANGAPVARAGVVVTLSSTGGAGTLTCATNPASTDTTGITTFSCTLDRGGSYTLHANAPGLASATSASFTVAVARARVVILIQGQSTSLDTSTVSSGIENGDSSGVQTTFHQTNGIIENLRQSGWNSVPFIEFSYTGGRFNAAGAWRPATYDCQDTFRKSLADDAYTLDVLIKGYARAHPNTDFYLIGHSQGGEIAMSYLSYLAGQGWPDLPKGGRIAGIAALDSPLGGIPQINKGDLRILAGTLCHGIVSPNNLVDMERIGADGSGLPMGGTRSEADALFGFRGLNNQNVARGAVEHYGTQILTVGNLKDWVYQPCIPHVPAFPSTEWLNDEGAASGVYARTTSEGTSICIDPKTIVENHGLVLTDPLVEGGIVDVFAGKDPMVVPTYFQLPPP